jgi:hypothetical protein
LIEADRWKASAVDADVGRLRRSGQLAVTMSVQPQGALVLPGPGPHRVMAQDDPSALDRHLRDLAGRGGPGQYERLVMVMVAWHQVLAALQACKDPHEPARLLNRPGDVYVCWPNGDDPAEPDSETSIGIDGPPPTKEQIRDLLRRWRSTGL